MSVLDVISLFGGLALFLYGMRIMSDSLKESSTGTLKKIMERVTNNSFKAFLLGAIITAIIQSSNATIVITSGLVSAGIISLKQSIGIIVGANVGTTVTGQIIRLMDIDSSGTAWLALFQPKTLAPIALIIGIVFIMFMNFKKSDTIGKILMGFGILFTGLMNMTSSVSVLSSSGLFDKVFMMLGDNPFVGYLIGAVTSLLLQSASATVGILQAFSVSGLLTFKSVYFVLLGVYLGVCIITSLICMIGAKSESKKVAIINIIFTIGKTLVGVVGVIVLHLSGALDTLWNNPVNSGIIADTNTAINLVGALILLPIVSKFEIIANHFVKEEVSPVSEYTAVLSGLDKKFYATPALAFNAAYKVLTQMFDLAKKNIDTSFNLLTNYDETLFNNVVEIEDSIDMMTDKLENYLLEYNSHISNDLHARMMNQYHNLTIEFERLGDYALNMAEHAKKLSDDGVKFSDMAVGELNVLRDLLNNILAYARLAFYKCNVDAANRIEPLEEVMDQITDELQVHHLKRLEKGACNIEGGTVFLNLLNDIERISDVCTNVGEATIARVYPEYQGRMHEYMATIKHGESEAFNKEYEMEYAKYHGELEKHHV